MNLGFCCRGTWLKWTQRQSITVKEYLKDLLHTFINFYVSSFRAKGRKCCYVFISYFTKSALMSNSMFGSTSQYCTVCCLDYRHLCWVWFLNIYCVWRIKWLWLSVQQQAEIKISFDTMTVVTLAEALWVVRLLGSGGGGLAPLLFNIISEEITRSSRRLSACLECRERECTVLQRLNIFIFLLSSVVSENCFYLSLGNGGSCPRLISLWQENIY